VKQASKDGKDGKKQGSEKEKPLGERMRSFPASYRIVHLD